MSLNLAECLELSAVERPDKLAVIHDDTRLTFRQLAGMAKRVAGILHAKGLGPGDTVALIAPNTPHFPILYYGILYAGCTVVALNVLLKSRELIHVLNDSAVKALFVFQGLHEDALHAAENVPTLEHVIVVEPDMTPAAPARGESFLTLMAAASPKFEMVTTRPDDTAVIMYTAATGGRLRGAQLTHFNLFQNAQTISQRVLKYYPEDVCLCALPLFHSFGQSGMMNAALLAGSSLVMVPRFDAGKVFDVIARERVTLVALVPTMFHLLLQYKHDAAFDLSSVRAAIAGGAKLPLELVDAFHARFGKTIMEGYGLTETSPVVAFNRSIETNRPGSVGPPIWGCQVRIRCEDGRGAGPGQTGEVILRGHNVFKGYLNDPEANAAAFVNGWFHTGDLGYLDDDGYLWLTGIKKDMIIRAGMNVYCREVEIVLEAHPAVQAAGVAGAPDPIRGEEVVAFVEIKPGVDFNERDLAGHCREQLAAYKCPRRFAAVAALPRTPDGQIDKPALRKQLQLEAPCA